MFKRISAFFLDIFQITVFAIAIFLFVYLLILQPHKIKGTSMEPNFHNSEFVLTDRLSYRFGEPSRGDVIVFKAPPDYQEEYIKRIIGLPNEQIMIKAGRVYINGEILTEPYLPINLYIAPGSFAAEGKTLTIPPDSFFAMGDNRNHSYDSRGFGFVEQKRITGRAWVIYWPLQRAGLIKKIEYSL
jgi:signal peptidase I